ncbi:hypothetical protein P153DRAFT_296025 [Dothidotthia symphoricarpi CBS 119687]|uniref:Heterokaryon incompatibility domain-containing protein n=1 Tax=Dothidotthia symphoricarpi CBS 119687 TaxID=1392245 RepID=A0A6A6A8F8_9PLEO|nr:uncharacterized protein P153DRAFT_296025 [Dothidotthia symphoricarpi CBS 119687]KAF2127107.1 hypothetical protein P153DRAFT_296025 [Dothidotthia symphoricarpi CBS 119687]
MPCQHPDIRKFDGLRCCLACGETEFEIARSTTTAQWQISDSTNQYQYSRLNYKLGQQIRLVDVLPGKRSDPVRCEMLHVNLDDDPDYEAVSYTWATEEGDDSKSKIIYFPNDESIQVTKNCEAVFRQLRGRRLARRFWVDAVCIDQNNVNERNHQVGLMDKIFAQASNVAICIQEENSAFDYTRLFVELQEVNYGVGRGFNSWLQPILRPILIHLFDLRYFQRVWVIQEVALAKTAYLRVNDTGVLLSPSVMSRLHHMCDEWRCKIPSVLRWNPGQRPETDIVTCLRLGLHCQSSDPRDKIYAVLSLMDSRSRSLIPVDYSLDIRTVYTHVLIAVAATRRNLNFLNHMDFSNGVNKVTIEAILNNEIPQTGFHWCLDFERTRGPWLSTIDVHTIAQLRPLPSLLDADCLTVNEKKVSAVTFEMPSNSACSSSALRFHVRAHYVDTIQSVKFSKHVTSKKGKGYFHIGKESYTILERLAHSWILEVFKSTPHVGKIKSAAMGKSLPYLKQEHAPGIDLPDLQSFVRGVKATQQYGCSEASTYTLFLTQYSVGCARHGFEENDEIFVVDGSKTPFILRKTGPSQYKIISECFVWALLELDYWNPGTKKGRWGQYAEKPQRVQTQMIEIVGPMLRSC